MFASRRRRDAFEGPSVGVTGVPLTLECVVVLCLYTLPSKQAISIGKVSTAHWLGAGAQRQNEDSQAGVSRAVS